MLSFVFVYKIVLAPRAGASEIARRLVLCAGPAPRDRRGSRWRPELRAASEARIRLSALRSPWPGVLTNVNPCRPAWLSTGQQACECLCEAASGQNSQALLDDLDDLVRADAARARRATRGRAGIVAAAALGGLAAYVVLPLAL